MKKVLAIFAILALCVGIVVFSPQVRPILAEPHGGAPIDEGNDSVSMMPVSWCEAYPNIRGDFYDTCMKCHTLSAGKIMVKETPPDNHMDYPNNNTRIYMEDGKKIGYTLYTEIHSGTIEKLLIYMERHEVDHLIIELYNPGGSIFEMWRIVNMMNLYKEKGLIIETRVSGMCASAAFVVFVNGTRGYRYVSPQAILMWHEIISFKFFDISTPSDTEAEAELLRKFQDLGNNFLAERSNMDKKELDRRVRKKEMWLTGPEALEHGFADKCYGDSDL